ncbi:MAG: cellulose binding domain-containing protein [Clostridiales bacterium]|nr:cellulose binding domain-containing protein [Clostridiales bacterium]
MEDFLRNPSEGVCDVCLLVHERLLFCPVFSCFFFGFPCDLNAIENSSNCYSVDNESEYSVEVYISSVWDSHANLEFVVTNDGSKTIHNWIFTFDLPYVIEGIWGAQVYETATGVCTIKNVGWNQDILPLGTIRFGMTVASMTKEAITDLPTFYLLNTKQKIVEPSCYNITFQQYSNWGVGYNGAINITNTSAQTIEDWQISFSCKRSIEEVAGAEISFCKDQYMISNNGTNQNIPSYSSINLTINGHCNYGDSGMSLENVSLFSMTCAYHLNEDKDLNGIDDYVDFINGLIQDPELDSDGDRIPDDIESELGTDPRSPDSDGDGINDGEEVMLGLDPLSEDSDGDGVFDSQEDDDNDGLTVSEEISLGSYPWTDDTDVDGISDGDEIYVYGTDLLNEDSDGDGIEDGDEIKIGANPLLPDSDADGIPDGEERFLQTREEEITDSERTAVNKVEVTLNGTGCLDSDMSIENMYGRDIYSSELVGLVGSPIEISYDGDFDSAILTFYYDEIELASTNAIIPDNLPVEKGYKTNPRSLGILYFDEESGLYIDCEADVDEEKHTVSCSITHFSEYMVVDMSIWHYFWTSMKYSGELRPSHEGYSGIDYVLEIPCVNTMTETDISEMNVIACKIIDNMQSGDRMVVRGYNTGGSYVYNYTTDKDLLKQQVIEWPWNETDSWVGYSFTTPDLLGTGLDALEIFNIASTSRDLDSNNEMVVIAFHNSTDIRSFFYSSNHRSKTEMIAYIFTLSSGDSETVSLKWLKTASGGGVIDCEGKTAEEVYDEFSSLYAKRQGLDLDVNVTDDEPGDGLWDIYEEVGMLSSNGHLYYSNPRTDDSDYDHLTDAAEMGICRQIEVDSDERVYLNGIDITDVNDPLSIEMYIASTFSQFGKGKWTIYGVKSNPKDEDTDKDGALDDSDATPKKKNESINYILIGKDKEGEDPLETLRNPYIKAFKKCKEKVIVLDIYEGSEYYQKIKQRLGLEISTREMVYYTFAALKCDLGADTLTNKQKYSSVDKMIIIAHGNYDILEFSPNGDGQVDLSYIVNSIYPACNIELLDIQACSCGDMQFSHSLNRETCVALEFARKKKVKNVYAWTDETKFLYGQNYSVRGRYVVYKSEQNTVSIENVGIIGKWFAPLEY